MESNSKLDKKIKAILVVLGFLALAGIVASVLMWTHIKSLSQAAANTDAEIKNTVSEISQFLLLPSDETPTLLTVTDLKQLQGQPFFARASVGDKVLIYAQAGRAVLWRPSIKKIIEVSMVSITPTSQ